MSRDGLIHRLVIIDPIRRYTRNSAVDSREQRRYLAASSEVLSVSMEAMISPVLASTARCGLRQDRGARPCFSLFHSPSEELQPGAVDHQVHRSVRDDLWSALRQATAAAARCTNTS